MLYNTPSKEKWKALIRNKVTTTWYNVLKNEALSMKTLEHVNIEKCQPRESHCVWNTTSTDPLESYRATIHAKILVQRYPLHTSHTTQSKNTLCPCCNTSEETLHHFMITCPVLNQACLPYLHLFLKYVQDLNITIPHKAVDAAILDPSTLTESSYHISQMVSISRTLCFRLHIRRLSFTNNKTTISARRLKDTANILQYRPAGCVQYQRTVLHQ